MFAPKASSEFDHLHTVVMRYAGTFNRDLEGPGIHPVLTRQMATSQWAPFSTLKVHAQQDALINLLTSHGAEVILLDPAAGCSCQHYTRDLGFVVDDTFFVARLNSEHRQPELDALLTLTTRLPNVAHLGAGTIEGGDVMLHTDSVLVGLSEETSRAGLEALRNKVNQLGIEREVVPIPFSGGGIVHLDDHFNIVSPQIALIHRSVFPHSQIRWFENHFDLIDVTDEEALAVQANVLAIAPDTVVVAQGSNRISAELTTRGIDVIPVDYSEVTKVPGSIRCSTLPLHRA